MTIELNHTIIPAADKWRSAKFLADILGLEVGPEWSHFAPIRTGNGVTLDYADASEFRRGHYAFLLSENEFDSALSRIKKRRHRVLRRLQPRRTRPDQPSLWRPRPLFRGPRRPSARNHHPPLRGHPRKVDRPAAQVNEHSLALPAGRGPG